MTQHAWTFCKGLAGELLATPPLGVSSSGMARYGTSSSTHAGILPQAGHQLPLTAAGRSHRRGNRAIGGAGDVRLQAHLLGSICKCALRSCAVWAAVQLSRPDKCLAYHEQCYQSDMNTWCQMVA